MICLQCKLSFPDDIKICPQCKKETVLDRRLVDDRRGDVVGQDQDQESRERRMSERRQQLIKRFEEVFWKGDAKHC